ncbi:hypothetical protein GOODEAATRI_022970 [Goodea atripinnis]|uniref:SEFIR domain-containing protein n=1 Tax=Goodea atripinnis TaxID=208336 RepID=A0ABV0NNJ3_9TELE
MAVSSVALALLPSCNQCGGHESNRKPEKDGFHGEMRGMGPRRLPEGVCQYEQRAAFQACPNIHFVPQQEAQPGHLVRQQQPFYERGPMNKGGLTGPSDRFCCHSFEETESLEPPLPLMSNVNWDQHNVPGYKAPCIPGQWNCCVCHLMSSLTIRINTLRNGRQIRPQVKEAPNVLPRGLLPQCAPPPGDVMREIDMFDNPIRRMGINKWMDRYLNDVSLIYGLSTYLQIQNEFIQQGCLNFRLVPVLFPNATKRHVPSWLQNTRIYRWPSDTQDLLLRLLREERYIIPQRGTDLTLTVRPL